MKIRYLLVLSAAVMVGSVGCSSETKEKAKEAVEKTGEAAKSAAKDTADNVEKGAEKVKDALNK